MPAGTTFRCDECGAERHFHPLLEYLADAGSLVPVPHPCEDLELERLGTTFTAAQRQRRLFMSDDWACARCGTVVQHRFLLLPDSTVGCAGLLALMVLVPAALFIVPSVRAAVPVPSPRAAGLVTGWWLAVRLGDAAITRWRFRTEWQPRRPRRCPACGSRWLRLAGAMLTPMLTFGFPPKRLVCDACGRRAMVCRATFRS